MTWPTRIRLPLAASEALAAAAERWSLEVLEGSRSQRQAREELCREVPVLGHALAAAAEALLAADAVVIEAVPAVDTPLVIAASAMGTPTTEDNGMPGRLVWDVRQEAAPGAAAQPQPPPDDTQSAGNPAESPSAPAAHAPTRPGALPLHTDSAHLERPHAVAALACVEPSPEGGVSLLVPVDRVVEALSAHEDGNQAVKLLQEPRYPFASVSKDGQPVHYHPILRFAQDCTEVRLSPLLQWGMRLAPLGAEHGAALDAFEAVLQRPELHTAIRLKAEDLLVFNNRNIVHGRTEITGGTGRHLKRLKLYAVSSG